MDVRLESLELKVEQDCICGSVLSPASALPGVLFVHGWGGSQRQDLVRAREAAGLGCVCLTFDLRGHERTAMQWENVSRAQNLADLLSAYDWLAAQPNVDPASIAVSGISYGGYLSTLLTARRPVRWLALRSPAIYKDEGWHQAKRQLHMDADLPAYRRRRVDWQENEALRACADFRGDVLLVQAEHDDVVPHMVMNNYVAAFVHVRSLTRRQVDGADHTFNAPPAQKAYNAILCKWLREMIMGAREEIAATRVRERAPDSMPDN
ncbi:dienelactone hydrolase [Lysobacter niastensis]|uniref:Dienelactone hydrolase n=1 Tax=Lysobacter niastensis TaxID=380629 RepID=A0ABU1WE35_9GAMM|nr:alpha/beta fold hydrolase [Lysobacter niastensis]MDR7135654.1 dienelactone hydrolase [Lysobacter niastensis]